MREQKTDVVYQCTVVSSWATFVTSSIILVIAVVVLFSVERDLWLPALFPEFFFLSILIGNYFSGYGILTITSDRVILSRFHHVIIEFGLDEITAAGYFVRLRNRDEQLFIAAEHPPKVITKENREAVNAQRYYEIRKMGNKKKSRYIRIDQTRKRTKIFQQLIPTFNANYVVKYPESKPSGNKPHQYQEWWKE
mgnify:CR=1 FL=1